MIHFHLEIKVSTEQQQRRDDGKSLGKREEEEKVLFPSKMTHSNTQQCHETPS